MEPTTLLPVISLLLLVSVEYGGWSLLGLLTGRGQLGEVHEQFFWAGHVHTGVLLGLGQKNRSSVGTVVTRIGALLFAAALIVLVIGLL